MPGKPCPERIALENTVNAARIAVDAALRERLYNVGRESPYAIKLAKVRKTARAAIRELENHRQMHRC